MKGFDGNEFSSYVKVNQNQGQLDYYKEDPDKPRTAQSNDTKQQAGQKQNEAKEEKEQKEQKPKKSRGPKM